MSKTPCRDATQTLRTGTALGDRCSTSLVGPEECREPPDDDVAVPDRCNLGAIDDIMSAHHDDGKRLGQVQMHELRVDLLRRT